MIQQGCIINENKLISALNRSFAKKKKGSKKGDEGASTEGEEEAVEEPAAPVEEPVVEAAPATPTPPAPKAAEKAEFAAASQSSDKQEVDKSLFGAFSCGDIKQIQSVENNKPPLKDDSVPGRYAEVLFTTASSTGNLFDVYEDIVYVQALFKNCESF